MRRLAIGAVLLALLALGCGGEAETEADAGAPVTLVPVSVVDLVDRIEATGELRAPDRARIAAEVGGRITEIRLEEGSRVEAGAIVLTIDPERRGLERDGAKAGADEALASLREAEREHTRMSDLRRKKVASETQLDAAATALARARSRADAARSELGVAERALRDAEVAAPYAGIVSSRMVSRGEYVQPGHALFELVALDPIEVEFQVTEVDSARVAPGQTVDVRLEPFPDETFGALVSYVSPVIDSRTRTLRVKGELENADGRLRPGLFARVDLGVERREGVLMIPEDAVLQRSDGAVVFRVGADRRAERVVVETGLRQHGAVEIVKGLARGDRVIVRGQARLVHGQPIVPRNPDGTPASDALPAVADALDAGGPRR